MNQESRPDMKDWEEQVNALLDGELDGDQAEQLKSAASQDQELAQAIIEAYQLQQVMASIPMERAPDSLRRKLARIPAEQTRASRPSFFQPRWAMALAAIPLVVMLAITQMGPREPTEAELAQAKQDLALALSYLAKASQVTGNEIENTIGEGFAEPVTENTVRTISDQFDLKKEREA
jgi:hypothetical protein